jgi:hypothetical protein
VFTLLAPDTLSLKDISDAGIKRLHFLPFKVDAQELLIVCNNNQIQRWICTPSSVYVSNVLCTVSSTQDGLPVQSQSSEQPTEVTQDNTTQDRPLWIHQQTINFTENEQISTIECSKDGVYCYIGFTNGQIRQYQLSDFQLIAGIGTSFGVQKVVEEVIVEEEANDEPPLKKKKLDYDSSNSSSIISIAISPNHTCIAAIDVTHVLHVYSIFPDIKESPSSWIKPKFELSMLNYTDSWDILVIIWKHLNQEQTEQLVKDVLDKKQKLSPQNRHFYAIHYERLYAILFRIIGGRKLAAMVNTQAKIMISCILNTIRNIETNKLEITKDESPATAIQNYERQLLEKVNSDSRAKKLFLSVIPLTNWVSLYLIFLFRDMECFSGRMVKAYKQQEKIPSMSQFYAIQNLKSAQLVMYLRDIIVCMYALSNIYYDTSNASNSKTSTQTSVPPLFNKEQIKHLLQFIWDVCKYSETHLSKPTNTKEQTDILYHRPNILAMKNLIEQHETNMGSILPMYDRMQLLDELDLIPQFNGVLAGDYWQQNDLISCERITPLKKYDIVTRHEIHTDGNYKICKTCSRITSIPLKGWASRWVAACQMCGGSYKSLSI